MSRHTTRSLAWTSWLALVAMVGCDTRTAEPPPGPDRAPAAARSEPDRDAIPPARQENPKFSYGTEKDRRFADFLREKSGGMVRQAAVGVDREGKLRVQVDKSVSPDETLPLTKSILAGARNDFPGRPFVLSVYDPQGGPILRARVDGEGGVRYEVVHEDGGSRAASGDRAAGPGIGSGASTDPMARSGRSEADRKFADWAEEHGRGYLRYVQADLERDGRLWFGVSREVKPADVPDLTRSLLEGAHRAFPRKEIVATVFDPTGERIGRAHLGSDGQIRWEH